MQSFLPTETDARRNHAWREWKLQVAVDYSVQNWKCAIEYLYSHKFGENYNNFKKISIVAGSLPYKPRNLGIKVSHGYREIAFCPVGYCNLNHPVGFPLYVPKMGIGGLKVNKWKYCALTPKRHYPAWMRVCWCIECQNRYKRYKILRTNQERNK